MDDDDLHKAPDTTGQGGILGPTGRRGGLGRTGKVGLAVGGIAVLGVAGWALSRTPAVPVGGTQTGSPTQASPVAQTGPATPTGPAPGPTQGGVPTDAINTAIDRVLDATESVWSVELPKQAGKAYEKPNVVLFTGRMSSACGTAQAASGPFYCPRDRTLYLDTAFFAEMQRRYSGSGDFAFPYVIAHEIGYHIQALLGLPQVQPAAGTAAANELPLRRELMADCLAGVWANRMAARQAAINMPDLRQAARTATSIGADSTKPGASAASAAPMLDSFTLGTAEQRTRWLSAGMRDGTVAGCNTLEGPI